MDKEKKVKEEKERVSFRLKYVGLAYGSTRIVRDTKYGDIEIQEMMINGEDILKFLPESIFKKKQK